MTRALLTCIVALGGLTALLAPGCKQSGIGDPCIPEKEYDPLFNSFDPNEVNIESKSFQCQTRLCLANHFRGRVSCPYGQNSDGAALPNGNPFNPKVSAGPCNVPGTTIPITGNPADTKTRAEVRPQCADRTTDKTVYCSCRCANLDGKTDDGANYCSCPDGYTCTQLVSSIGAGDVGLTGAYCIKKDTEYDRALACSTDCDPDLAKCVGGTTTTTK